MASLNWPVCNVFFWGGAGVGGGEKGKGVGWGRRKTQV